jgi:hypothetical protein
LSFFVYSAVNVSSLLLRFVDQSHIDDASACYDGPIGT